MLLVAPVCFFLRRFAHAAAPASPAASNPVIGSIAPPPPPERVFPPLLELAWLLELFAEIKFKSVGEEGAEEVIWGCELVRVESDAMGASGRLT